MRPFLVLFLCVFGASSSYGQLRRVETVQSAVINSPDLGWIAAASGIFDLKTSKGPNSCRMTLWPEGAKGKYPVSMPTGCHKAFPSLLIKVKNWTLGNDGSIVLQDEKALTLLEFREDNGKLLSPATTEIIYELQPADAGWFKRQASLPRKTENTASAKPVDGADMARVAGTYALTREKGKPSECKIVFSTQAYIKSGFMKAGIGEGCQDRGMQIFNPVAWKLEPARLVLVSRKGHDMGFVRAGVNGWTKEKKSGEPLELVKN